MFTRARLRLTLWYLIIIMIISFIFSALIYGLLSREIDRFAATQRDTIEQNLLYEQAFSDAELLFLYPSVASITSDAHGATESKNRLAWQLTMINGIILVVSGIAAYVLAGENLKPLREMVDEQNRFIGDASHELRTPLTAIKTAMEVAHRDAHLTVKESRAVFQQSIEEIDRLQLLTNNLLQLAQCKEQLQEEPAERVDVRMLAERVAARMQHIAQEKNCTIVVNGKEVVPIAAKEAAIDQVFMIFIDNAVKYSKKNQSITVTVKKNNRTAIVTFHDIGIGIAPEDLPHIFDRFYRADSARKATNSGGFGLGLPIAQKIVQGYKGTIEVQSSKSNGTIFTLRFPLFS